MFTRIALVVLVALLALPIAETASPVGAKPRSRTVTRTFRNTAPIAIPISDVSPVGSANLYPATVAVSGLKQGTIRDINLLLTNLHHAHPDDVQVLLVGPSGQTAIVMANVGHYEDVTGVTLRLDDEAAAPLPDYAKLENGSFRPTSRLGGAIAFNAPAPEAGANTALSIFDGGNPNGTWRLFVKDGAPLYDGGAISGGWTLELKVQVKAKKKKR